MKKNFAVEFWILLTIGMITFGLSSCSDSDDDEEDESESTSSSVEESENTEEEDTGSINGYEYVNLGLSVKWATKNVGAKYSYSYGQFYMWGDIEVRTEFLDSGTWNVSLSDISGNSKYDAARYEWGSTWRMPTLEEIQELVDDCTWTWSKSNGIYGYLVTGPSGNSIFLPAGGYRTESTGDQTGEYGYYWSSTPGSTTTVACRLDFSENHINAASSGSDRRLAHLIRPVSD